MAAVTIMHLITKKHWRAFSERDHLQVDTNAACFHFYSAASAHTVPQL